MHDGGRRSSPWVTVLIVVGVLTLLCCVAGGIASYFGMRKVEEAGGVQGALRGMVTEMAGPRDPAARDFVRVYLVDGDADAAYERTSSAFRGLTDRDQFDELQRAILRVMGAYHDATIRNYNVHSNLGTGPGAGKVHKLIYDATFEHGPATVHIHLREVDGELRVEMFRVESPRFLSTLAGEDESR